MKRLFPPTILLILTANVASVTAFAPQPSLSASYSQSRIISSISSHKRENDLLIESITQPLTSIASATTAGFLAASLLFSSPLLPPPEAQAASSIPATATSIEIDLSSLPSLTRKAITNRDAISKYIVESASSLKPILNILSESDTVVVKPPKDVKGAFKNLATGEAQFVLNGKDTVDVRVESVPGVVVVRIINPNIPRLPFLKDGTAALKFVDGVIDSAVDTAEDLPAELLKARGEVEAVERFLTWGAPEKVPIQYKGSGLDKFLSDKFLVKGEPVNLGSMGYLTNSEVVFSSLFIGTVGVYASSYAYYVWLNEEAERESLEKKAATEAKKAAKAKKDADKAEKDAKAKKEAEAKKEEEARKAKAEKEAKELKEAEAKAKAEKEAAAKAKVEEQNATIGSDPTGEGEDSEANDGEGSGRKRKRDVIKDFFRRRQ